MANNIEEMINAIIEMKVYIFVYPKMGVRWRILLMAIIANNKA
jgi:UPF0716 family protein affecting phage T7 exclusion